MSSRPAIGLNWFLKYQDQTFPQDSVILRGKPVLAPKYYLKKTDEVTRKKVLAKRKADEDGVVRPELSSEELRHRKTILAARQRERKRGKV